MTSYIRSNRRSWFTINESLKRNNNTPKKTKQVSLLQRPESDTSDEMDKTAYYVQVIRDAFKRNIDVKEQ